MRDLERLEEGKNERWGDREVDVKRFMYFISFWNILNQLFCFLALNTTSL